VIKKGDIINYKVTNEFTMSCELKLGVNISSSLYCIFIKDVKEIGVQDKSFVYCRINSNLFEYVCIESSRIQELPTAQQKDLSPLFNKVKVLDYKESAEVYGFRIKKKNCTNKIYSNYKRDEAKHSKKLNKTLDCLVIETEYGNLTFLHSECEYISPNLNREPKRDKTYKINRVVRYKGIDDKIDKSISRVIIKIDGLNPMGYPKRSSIITTVDTKTGIEYKDYRKNFKLIFNDKK